MADIYFQRTKVVSGEYWKLVGVKNVLPAERSGLSLALQEYQVMSGDIGEPEMAARNMETLRNDLQAEGHRIHMQESKAEAAKIVNRLLESEEPRKPIDYGERLRKLRIRQGRNPETGDLLPEDHPQNVATAREQFKRP